jgi:hypothetical protein
MVPIYSMYRLYLFSIVEHPFKIQVVLQY